jgi:internalin A
MMLFPCNVSDCNQAHDISRLLQNAPIARRPSMESLLTEGFGDMRSRLDELRQQNIVMDQNLRRIMSQVEDAFRGLMHTITDEGKEGPRLFSLEPVDHSAFNPNGWVKKKFRVTLWCEHTRLPLPLLNKGNNKEGMYEFEVTRAWFAAAAPFLKALTGTLSLVLPVAASAAKLAIDEVTYKGLEKQLGLGKSCAEAMVNATGKVTEWVSEDEGLETELNGVIHAEGAVLRQFQAWIKKEDPGFGDLRKVLNKQKEFLWVHRDFEKEY